MNALRGISFNNDLELKSCTMSLCGNQVISTIKALNSLLNAGKKSETMKNTLFIDLLLISCLYFQKMKCKNKNARTYGLTH